VPDIFDEVEEDLRAERMRRLLKRYGGLLVAAVLLVVAGVGGWQYWQSLQAKRNAAVASQYLSALDAAASEAPAARQSAAAALTAVARSGNAGYAVLAELRAAALDADLGKEKEAAALWAKVAGDSAADPLLRDVAVLQSVLHQIGKAPPAELKARLAPLIGAASPWRPLAEEAQALIDLEQGEKQAARTTLKRLADDVTAPEGVRGRASALLAWLDE
jgi:hypothetical protein